MTTSSQRAFVSIAAAIAITLALGGCVHASSRLERNFPATDVGPASIRFDNLGVERVDVYLIGTKHEWHLGRVEPGASASLEIPEEAFRDGAKVRLAVLADERVTFQAARDPRAKVSIPLTPSSMLSQRWSFSQGELGFVQY